MLSWVLQRKWWFGALLLLIVGGFFVIRARAQPVSASTFEPVERGTIEETIEVPGKVDAERKASLRFLAGGKVVSLPVQEGQNVKKNDRIASIDARDLQKNLSKSLNDYLTNRWTFDQGKDDRKDSALTDALRRVADKTQFSLNNAITDVELKDIALKNATLTSPIDGVVTSLPVKVPGVQVLSTDVFEIVDPSALEFVAEVDEVDIGKVMVGTPVRMVLDAYPDQKLDGTVDRIGLKAQSSSKSSGSTVFPVHIKIQFPDITHFRLGMNGTLTIILQKKDGVLTVPIESTLSHDGKTFVKVRDPKNPTKEIEKEVQLGIEGDTEVEVLSGLSQGDSVAIPK
jgi:HlyD family secretion protein